MSASTSTAEFAPSPGVLGAGAVPGAPAREMSAEDYVALAKHRLRAQAVEADADMERQVDELKAQAAKLKPWAIGASVLLGLVAVKPTGGGLIGSLLGGLGGLFGKSKKRRSRHEDDEDDGDGRRRGPRLGKIGLLLAGVSLARRVAPLVIELVKIVRK